MTASWPAYASCTAAESLRTSPTTTRHGRLVAGSLSGSRTSTARRDHLRFLIDDVTTCAACCAQDEQPLSLHDSYSATTVKISR
jgi:hypothetical protein